MGDASRPTGSARPTIWTGSGLLGPRTLLAHGVWLDGGELELIAERGATVVTNPTANMKLAVGRAFPYREAVARQVSIGLGTDGASSNNNLDMLEEMKLLSLLQKHEAGDPAVLPAAEAVAIARGLRSALIGGRPLAPGEPADFLLLRHDLQSSRPASSRQTSPSPPPGRWWTRQWWPAVS